MAEDEKVDVPEAEFGTLFLLKIPTTNIYRAQIFYTEVFGWSFKRMDPSSIGTPRAFFQKGSLRGYLIEIPTGQSLSTSIFQVTPIISVEDIDEATARIRKAGGLVFDKYKNVSMGVGVNCTDTEGNKFDVWSKYGKLERDFISRKVPDQGR